MGLKQMNLYLYMLNCVKLLIKVMGLKPDVKDYIDRDSVKLLIKVMGLKQ